MRCSFSFVCLNGEENAHQRFTEYPFTRYLMHSVVYTHTWDQINGKQLRPNERGRGGGFPLDSRQQKPKVKCVDQKQTWCTLREGVSGTLKSLTPSPLIYGWKVRQNSDVMPVCVVLKEGLRRSRDSPLWSRHFFTLEVLQNSDVLSVCDVTFQWQFELKMRLAYTL